MNLEYCKGYCQDCKTEHKLERKKPNHIIHFLITVTLGIFTYGIGSVVWMIVWYLFAVKFTHWTCHVCGGKSVEPLEHNTEHHIEDNKKDEKHTDTSKITKGLANINIVEKLQESSKIIIGLLVLIPIIIFLSSLDFNNNDDDNMKKKEEKENIVNARVDVKDDVFRKSTLKYNKVESAFCYIYDIEQNATSIKGLVSCKEGKLILDLYNSETKSVIETKTVPFKNNRFYIKVDTPGKIDFKFAVKLTKEQIEARQKEIEEEKIPSISSNGDSQEEENKDKCSIISWNHSKYSSEYLIVQGKTSCKKGQIELHIFDENNINLGMETDSFESGVFTIFFQTNSNPTNITLKYTISQK